MPDLKYTFTSYHTDATTDRASSLGFFQDAQHRNFASVQKHACQPKNLGRFIKKNYFEFRLKRH